MIYYEEWMKYTFFNPKDFKRFYPRYFSGLVNQTGWVDNKSEIIQLEFCDGLEDKIDSVKPDNQCLVISGEDRVGKDWLGDEINKLNSKYVPIGIADELKCLIAKDLINTWNFPVKDVIDLIFLDRDVKGISKEHVRELYKFYGEAKKKFFGKDYWINNTIKRMQILLHLGKIPIITDLRFPEEEVVLEPWTKEIIKLKVKGQNELWFKVNKERFL